MNKKSRRDQRIFWQLLCLIRFKIFVLTQRWNNAVLTSMQRHNVEKIEDIYSFTVNTINIVIEWNENISSFTSAKHEWKFECFHYTRWKCLWYSLKKSKFSFYFIVYTSMRVSDVISNVTKQNMNVMASTLNRWRNKNKKFRRIKITWYQNVPYILTKKMHTKTW